jgi:6,7-dimethyl-8-ribityllumazine synthase
MDIQKITPQVNIDIEKDIKNKKVAIVYSMWHSKYISQIREKLKTYLKENGIENIEEYEAPGSNEVPFISTKIAKNADGILCVGILIKGDSLHFENISSAVSNGIMFAQITTGIPMMNIIFSCYNYDQVEERISGKKSTLEYVVKGLIKII